MLGDLGFLRCTLGCGEIASLCVVCDWCDLKKLLTHIASAYSIDIKRWAIFTTCVQVVEYIGYFVLLDGRFDCVRKGQRVSGCALLRQLSENTPDPTVDTVKTMWAGEHEDTFVMNDIELIVVTESNRLGRFSALLEPHVSNTRFSGLFHHTFGLLWGHNDQHAANAIGKISEGSIGLFAAGDIRRGVNRDGMISFFFQYLKSGCTVCRRLYVFDHHLLKNQ